MDRRISAAMTVAALATMLVVGSAAASLLNPPVLSADHGSPGTVVHVNGFPATTICPSVRMYIARVAGITSFDDPRLVRLRGSVTFGLGTGGSSTGPLTRVPFFRFTVPSLEPRSYMTYYTCVGGTGGWSGLSEDAAFRVDPLPPGATLPPTTTLSAMIPSSGEVAPAVWLLIGLLSIAVASASMRRTGRRPL